MVREEFPCWVRTYFILFCKYMKFFDYIWKKFCQILMKSFCYHFFRVKLYSSWKKRMFFVIKTKFKIFITNGYFHFILTIVIITGKSTFKSFWSCKKKDYWYGIFFGTTVYIFAVVRYKTVGTTYRIITFLEVKGQKPVLSWYFPINIVSWLDKLLEQLINKVIRLKPSNLINKYFFILFVYKTIHALIPSFSKNGKFWIIPSIMTA